CPYRFVDGTDQLRKRRQVRDRGRSEMQRLGEPCVDRVDVILCAELRLLRVDEANPIGERFLRRDLSPEQGVIEVAMGIDQTWQQTCFTEIEHIAVVNLADMIKLA